MNNVYANIVKHFMEPLVLEEWERQRHFLKPPQPSRRSEFLPAFRNERRAHIGVFVIGRSV